MRPVVPLGGVLSRYSRRALRADALAALSLWALLVPQALAYAELAGLPPVTGLYTGLFAMVAYALFGRSRYLTVGPESSVALLVASSVAPLAGRDPARYAALAALLAVLTGGWLLVGAVLRAGAIVRLLSAPVLVGYLAGSAIIMAVSQLSKVLGYSADPGASTVLIGLARDLERTNGWAVAIGLGTVIALVVLGSVAPRTPAALLVLAAATALVAATGLHRRVTVVGHVDAGLPVPAVGDLRLADIPALAIPALSVAVLVFVSSALTGTALAVRDGEDLPPTGEFVGLGAANVAAGLFGGFPANGSDSRSFLLAESGGRSQVANLFGAGLVLVTLVALTPVFSDLPSAALGGVILVTAAKLVDLRALRRLRRVRTADFTLASVTFGGVLLTGVLGGIAIGVLASLLDVVRRTVVPRTSVLGVLPGDPPTYRAVGRHPQAETLPGIIVYRFEAPIFFANAEAFRGEILQLVRASQHRVHDFVVNAEGVNDLDVTAVDMLARLVGELADEEVRLSFARVRGPVRDLMRSTGLESRIGAAGFFPRVTDAVAAARVRHSEQS